MSRRTAASLAVLLACCASASAQIWVIDPVRGVDVAGGGSAAAPLKTITFATRLAAPLGAGVFLLRPGRYDAASGESFPIDLPPLARVVRDPAFDADGRPVEIATPLALNAAFQLESAAPLDAIFERVVIRGGSYRAIQVIPHAAKLLSSVIVRDCQLACSRGVALQAHGAALLAVAIEGSAITAPEVGVLCVAGDLGTRVDLRIDRTRIEGGFNGIVLDASADAAIDAAVRATLLRGFGTGAVRSTSATNGAVSSRLEHALLADVGQRVFGGNPAALSDVVGSGGIAGRHVVVNCLFEGNRADVSATRGFGAFTFGANLVEQANLVGLGGNVLGTASYATGGSGRLAHASPGLDLGRANDVTLALDLDGLPRMHSSSGAPDVGPYERHFGAVPPAFRTARLGAATTQVELFVQGPAQAPCALLFGLPGAGGFGPGNVHLFPPFVDVGLGGVLDATGTAELALRFPTVPGLTGFEFGAQAIVLASPHLGVHAGVVRLVR